MITDKQRLIALGVFIAVIVSAVSGVLIFMPNSFELMSPGNTAYIIDSTRISVGFYNYFFEIATTPEALMYQETQNDNFDASVALDEQYYDEERAVTWQDYYSSAALEQIQSLVYLSNRAAELGLKLEREQQESIEEQILDLRSKAKEYSVSLNNYISIVYGDHAGEKTYRKIAEKLFLAQNYCEYIYLSEEFSGKAESLVDKSLDASQCSVKEIFIVYGEDAEGKEQAEGLVADIKSRLDSSLNKEYLFSVLFNCYMKDYDSHDRAITIQKGDPDKVLGEWLFDHPRNPGDYIMLEDKNGYHFICYADKGERYPKRIELASKSLENVSQKVKTENGYAFRTDSR